MSSSILHQCPSCGHVSDISLSLASFIENPHCTQCGLSASESTNKIQDELSMLFEQQMTMTMTPPTEIPQSPQTPTLPIPISPPSYSISQHYNHSAHIVSSAPTQTQTSRDSMEMNMNSAQETIQILQNHGLNPAAFSHAQLELFRNADDEQKRRLIQTWQIYNSAQTCADNQDCEMSLEYQHQPLNAEPESEHEHAEPYMTSGYEVSSTNTTLPMEPSTGKPYEASTDPVYGGQQWWEMPRSGNVSGNEMAENQYGMFEERSRFYSGMQVQRCFH